MVGLRLPAVHAGHYYPGSLLLFSNATLMFCTVVSSLCIKQHAELSKQQQSARTVVPCMYSSEQVT